MLLHLLLHFLLLLQHLSDARELLRDGCVAFHSQAAVKRGATREEIMEVMGMALYMGAGPSLMYAAQAVEAFDQFAAQAGTEPGSA